MGELADGSSIHVYHLALFRVQRWLMVLRLDFSLLLVPCNQEIATAQELVLVSMILGHLSLKGVPMTT